VTAVEQQVPRVSVRDLALDRDAVLWRNTGDLRTMVISVRGEEDPYRVLSWQNDVVAHRRAPAKL